MTKIQYAKSIDALLRGAESLLIVAPKARFTKARIPAKLPEVLRSLAIELARDLKTGDLGANASTLTGDKPARLQIGVLPDSVSRYNSPARAESVRKVVAAAQLGRLEKAAVLLALDDDEHVLAAANAVGRALPLFSMKSGPAKRTTVQLLAVGRKGEIIGLAKPVRETVGAAREIAKLVDSPPTDMNPDALAKAARAMLKDLPNVTIKEIRGDALLKARLCGVHAVGRTAISAPRVLVATCTPARAKKGHVAIVGKGVTYDTGGLHLKARGAMETMKADMGGAAATLGAFRVLAATGVRHKLSLVLCLAENSIGPLAYKPDDILTMHSGKTVEINNTDAEGRILLADGVSYAARVLKAHTIFDAATLTGAQLIATGNLHAAVFSNDPELERAAIEAGYRSGDLVHPLPFAPELYKQEFASTVADMRNSVKNRANAQSSCAAQFIYWHIEDSDVRWCHVDLAGPAFRSLRATGFGVALLAECVRALG